MNTEEHETMLEQAWAHLEGGDLAGARRVAERLKREAPKNADVYTVLAACAREEDDAETALDMLKVATEIDPDWATPRLWTAEILAADPDRLLQALQHATAAVERAEEEIEFLDAVALKAGIEVDLGRLDVARRTLGELPATEGEEIPPEIDMEIAHLLLAVEDTAAALRRFQSLVKASPDWGDAWHGLGLACDAVEDDEGRRKAWLETLMIDRKETDERRLSDDEIEGEADGVLATLPPRARSLLKNVPIIVADYPAKRDVEDGVDPRILGMFVGKAYPEESAVMGTTPELTQILLFRRNLERVAEDKEELREEIRTTIIHETGHFFGMSEDELAAVGLE